MVLAAPRPRLFLMLAVLVLHGVLGMLLLRWLPQGFLSTQLLFWSNTVLPGVLAAACVAGLVVLPLRPRASSALLWGLAGGWGAGGVVASLFFPKSLPLAWLAGLAVAAALGALAWPDWRRAWGRVAGLVLPGVVLGAVGVLAQRAPLSSTHPLNMELPRVDGGWGAGEAHWQSPNGTLRISPIDGETWLECGGLKLHVYPLLTFISRSPDRAWSNLAPASVNIGSWQLLALNWTDQTFSVAYRGTGTSVLNAVDTGESIILDSYTLLSQSVFSHLNSYLKLEIDGRPGLKVEFSAVPGKPVEFRPAEYPSGLPARAAYLTADQTLHIVEATRAEKGPFLPLQEGKLEGPLVLTLHDEQGPVCGIQVGDWAPQASTEPSPTAGWGLPQNAIEFHLKGREAAAPAEVLFTLAGTSLGRGWNTVGHGPGVYANRLEFRSLREAPEPPSPH